MDSCTIIGAKSPVSNRPEGGATFRVEIPAAPAMFPSRGISPAPRGTPAKLT